MQLIPKIAIIINISKDRYREDDELEPDDSESLRLGFLLVLCLPRAHGSLQVSPRTKYTLCKV